MPPDAERLVADHLRAASAVTAIVGSRVSTELPPQPTFPAVTLTRTGGVPSVPGYLDGPRLELAAWGTTKAQAQTLARAVEAAMLALVGTHTLGVVTLVIESGEGLRWDPDDTFDPDQPRYHMIFDVYLHA